MAADETQEVQPPEDFALFDSETGEEKDEGETVSLTTAQKAEREVQESRGDYGGPWADEEERKIWGPKVYDVPEPEEEGE